jgi:hypothetical protein
MPFPFNRAFIRGARIDKMVVALSRGSMHIKEGESALM